jgi:steroid delta-isomerase-like uncharacterized protein
MSEATRDLLSRYYREVWEGGDVAALDRFLADDYVDHDPSPGFGSDKEGAKRIAAAVTNSMKDGHLTIRDVIVEGDRAAAHWTHTWTQTGDFLGMVPADGRRIQLRGHDFFLVRDGRIAEVWHCEDFFGVLAQLGALPGPR